MSSESDIVLDAKAVLTRAGKILTQGALPSDWQTHGANCVFCACALAKTQLDEECDTGVSVAHALADFFSGHVTEEPTDAPLTQATHALILALPLYRELGCIEMASLTQQGALMVIQQAYELCE